MNPRLTSTREPQMLQMLTDAQSTMARLFDVRARHLGLSRPQWRVLAGLNGRDGITQTELSDATAIARSPLGKIIDQLEEAGFIERRGDPDDRRINRLYITDEAGPLLEPARQLAAELEAEVLEKLPKGDNLNHALEHLCLRLHELMIEELHGAPGRRAQSGAA